MLTATYCCCFGWEFQEHIAVEFLDDTPPDVGAIDAPITIPAGSHFRMDYTHCEGSTTMPSYIGRAS